MGNSIHLHREATQPCRRKLRKKRTGANSGNFNNFVKLWSLSMLLHYWFASIVGAIHGGDSIRGVDSSGRSLEMVKSRLRSFLLRRHKTSAHFGFYYGIPRMVYEPFAFKSQESEATTLTKGDNTKENDDVFLAQRKYYEGYEKIGKDVENWAQKMLDEGNMSENTKMSSVPDRDGWTEVFCAKPLRQKFNIGSNSSIPTTRQWVKWMKDSRGRHADSNDNQKHPCMKLFATIDAPFPIVCRYLSEKNRFREYNSLLIDQEDVEVLSPHSKICWSQSKKLLFIQPRDFVTYCRHRWLNDGTQLITNQACEHPSTTLTPGVGDENKIISGMSGFRAFSLRGATYISRCPDFPNERTKLVMLSHCNCGRDVPEWAVRTAVGVLAPIKPFEIIHRIEVGIRRAREALEKAEKEETPKSAPPGRSSQPAGMAQMGYACFWPEGGGLVDGLDE